MATAEERIYSDILDDGGDLPAVTEAYIDVVRESIDAGSLTTEQAIRRLTDVANDVSEWCGECADAIDRELENLRG